MSPEPRKLQKLRTFRDDVNAVKGAAAVPVVAAEEKAIPEKPRVTIAPVLNERKNPIVIPTVLTKVIPPVPQPAPVAPNPTSLQSDITAALGGPKVSAAPEVKNTSSTARNLIQNTEPKITEYTKEPVQVMDRGGDDMGGTVITDQKRDRFRLLPSMWEAVKLWFQDTENALARRAEKKRQAIPTVRTFEDRKDIIKKAASVGAIAPKDDYAKLAKKLPARSDKPIATPTSTVMIAEKAAVPAPSWGHFEGQAVPVVAEVKQVSPTVTQVLPPPAAIPVPTPPPIPVPSVAEIPVETPRAEPTIVEEVAPVIAPAAVEPPRPEPVVAPRKVTAKTKRNFAWLFYVGVTTTAIIAIISGATLVSWLLGDAKPTNITVNSGPTNIIDPTPIREDSTVRAILPRTRAEWYANVSVSGRGGVLTIIPVINIGGAEKTAEPADVLATLSWAVESSLTRSISDITFVMAEQKPVIILKVTTFDAAFGGLLLSEKELSGELSPLFGPVVTSTYKVGIGTVAPQFIDELAANHDVRVLKDEMENERLVYGFIDQNTVVIAPDKEAFLLIAERLR